MDALVRAAADVHSNRDSLRGAVAKYSSRHRMQVARMQDPAWVAAHDGLALTTSAPDAVAYHHHAVAGAWRAATWVASSPRVPRAFNRARASSAPTLPGVSAEPTMAPSAHPHHVVGVNRQRDRTRSSAVVTTLFREVDEEDAVETAASSSSGRSVVPAFV